MGDFDVREMLSKSATLGLSPLDDASYDVDLKPINLEDVMRFRRRCVINHSGCWIADRETTDRLMNQLQVTDAVGWDRDRCSHTLYYPEIRCDLTASPLRSIARLLICGNDL
jgi:hypothetical protein